jgi:hypothetical protein
MDTLYAADVIASRAWQEKLNACLQDKGQTVRIDCGDRVVHWKSRDMVRGEPHKKIAEAFKLFRTHRQHTCPGSRRVVCHLCPGFAIGATRLRRSPLLCDLPAVQSPSLSVPWIDSRAHPVTQYLRQLKDELKAKEKGEP